jgi:hypothetical protein
MKMDVLTKSIRKLMGWCPNLKTLETQHSIHPESFEANNQSRGKDAGNSPVLPSGWWNKRHNRMLILSSLTLFSLCWIGFQGVNFRDEAFIMGLILGIILNPLFCIWDLRFLDKIKNSNKGVQTKNKLTTLGGILGLISLLIESSSSGWRYVLTFSLTCASGFCLTFFLYYFMLVYWEKKNNKIVLLYGSETYVINAGKE